MKTFLITILLVSWAAVLNAQVRIDVGPNSGASRITTKILDQATLRCYYLFSRKSATDALVRADTMVLYVGDSLSKFYDPGRFMRDSLVRDKMSSMEPSSIKSIRVMKGESAAEVSSMPGSTIGSNANLGESYQFIKNRQSNQVSVIDYTAAIGDRFRYEDKLGALPWKIEGGTEKVLDYTCQRATLTFRGRTYTAWFTPEIPVADGPWKFMGLPGLITKVEDSEKLFSFILIGLEQLPSPVAINIENLKYIKCTREELEKLKKKQGPGMQINNNAGNVIIAEMPGKYEYNPMELE